MKAVKGLELYTLLIKTASAILNLKCQISNLEYQSQPRVPKLNFMI